MTTARRLSLALAFLLTAPFAQAADPDGMTYLDAVVLGVVEGITEYLPISSTGHLVLTNALLGLDSEQPLTDDAGQPIILADGAVLTRKAAADAYVIVIQFGAIVAVVLLYFGRIMEILRGLLGRHQPGRLLARNLIMAFLPAVFLGLLLDDWIESKLFAPLPIAIALAAGGVLMLAVERWRKRRDVAAGGAIADVDLHELSVRQSLIVGLMQCVAMWPGTSRSMMTIVGGYVVGLRPARAAEFSFLLGLITLSAAAAYKALSSREALMLASDLGPSLLGIVVAFVFAALAVKWLVAWLTRHGLGLFAWYRMVLAVLVVVFLVM
jgi:undecaprenyl-diphosphatase